MSFTSPTATASVAFRPNGIYYGYVTSVNQTTRRVYVNIARLNGGTELGPLQVLSVNLPSVGALVGCVFAENRSDELLVIGPIQQSSSLRYSPPVTCTSTTRPASGQVPAGTLIFETDTNKTLVWNGTSWVGLSTGGNFTSNNVFINSNGIGIGAASIRPPLTITSSYDPIQSTAVTNASAGAIQIGAVNSTNMVIDHNSIQSRNNGAVAGLTLNPKGGEVTIGGTLNVTGGLNAGSLSTGTVPGGRLAGNYSGITGLGGLTTLNVGNLRLAQSGEEITGSYTINSQAYELLRVQGTFRSGNPYTWLAFKNGMKIGQYNNGVPNDSGVGGGVENWAGVFFTASATLGGDNSIGASSAATFYPGIMSAPNNPNVIISCKPGGAVKIRPAGNSGTNEGLEIRPLGQAHRLRSRLEVRGIDGSPAAITLTDATGTQSILGLAVNLDAGPGDTTNSAGLYAPGRPGSPWVLEVRRNGEIYLNELTTGTQTNAIALDAADKLVNLSSLLKYKENISSIGSPLTVLSSLRPRAYTFKPEEFGVTGEYANYFQLDQRYGFIVDELQEDAPNFVTYKFNSTDGEYDLNDVSPSYWRTDDMIALLTAGVQELVATIDQLEQRIADLES